MFDFHVSDLGTKRIPDSKYYWQNERAACCVLVPDSSRENVNEPVTLTFMQAAPDVTVFCTHLRNPDIAVVSTYASGDGDVFKKRITVDRVDGRCARPEGCGKIFNAILNLIDNNSWSFPRAQASTPYITKEQAELFENSFRTMVQAPDNGRCIYASVSKAGTMLAKRINIVPEIEFQVSHYDTETNTQDDSHLKVTRSVGSCLVGKTVIVIDDLISSGRTANAVVQHILDAGADRVYFFALYRTICSQEVDLCSDPRVVIQSSVPISNAYWMYGRGFDLSDDASRDLPDIYASTKHWEWEKDADVNELIDLFGGNYHVSDYPDKIW